MKKPFILLLAALLLLSAACAKEPAAEEPASYTLADAVLADTDLCRYTVKSVSEEADGLHVRTFFENKSGLPLVCKWDGAPVVNGFALAAKNTAKTVVAGASADIDIIVTADTLSAVPEVLPAEQISFLFRVYEMGHSNDNADFIREQKVIYPTGKTAETVKSASASVSGGKTVVEIDGARLIFQKAEAKPDGSYMLTMYFENKTDSALTCYIGNVTADGKSANEMTYNDAPAAAVTVIPVYAGLSDKVTDKSELAMDVQIYPAGGAAPGKDDMLFSARVPVR